MLYYLNSKIYELDKYIYFLFSGLVSDIKEPVTQVALGKAHIVALTNKGHVHTFGINHKGQCGREFIHGPNRDGKQFSSLFR